jgi:hypothetical protein
MGVFQQPVRSSCPSAPLVQVKNEMLRLVMKFDKKPFVEACASHNCNNIATRASLYRNNVFPMWWCDECDPDPIGVLEGRIQIVETYMGTLNRVKNYCGGKKGDYKYLIRAFAHQAKGLPKRVGEAQAQAFFL